MKQPEEIKKGLEQCANTETCENCGYRDECMDLYSNKPVTKDALAYIQQLESSRMSKPHDDNKLTPKDFNFSKKGIPPETPPLIQGRIEIDELIKGSEYVKQLESRLAQVERERDAAASDARLGTMCDTCKHNTDHPLTHPCTSCDEYFNFWEWRGVCAENTEEN